MKVKAICFQQTQKVQLTCTRTHQVFTLLILLCVLGYVKRWEVGGYCISSKAVQPPDCEWLHVTVMIEQCLLVGLVGRRFRLMAGSHSENLKVSPT